MAAIATPVTPLCRDAVTLPFERQRMTNSTPNLVAWLVEYRKYLILVADGANDEAALLRKEIEEGLNWVELTWADLEFANNSDQSLRFAE